LQPLVGAIGELLDHDKQALEVSSLSQPDSDVSFAGLDQEDAAY
jgi:hypothetical protein